VDILEKITRDKQREVDTSLASMTTADLTKKPQDLRNPLDFREALTNDSLSIISEVKKASPSKGLIRPDFDPTSIACAYEQAGTNCISILTEIKYFQGAPEFLVDIRKQVSCPLLRKDFIVDERQIRESYDLGADAILLIVSALNEHQLSRFKELADDFGLSCLTEIHTEAELETALKLDFELIGINNRNLTTFVTDIENSIRIKERIPNHVTTVSESGIKTPDDCLMLNQAGFDAVLVGETLMREPDPGKALENLMSKVR
jgi:indole-3-glycerol phosphate synthase